MTSIEDVPPCGGNLLSLWTEAIKTPTYPTYEFVRDDEGNKAYDMDLRHITDLSKNLSYRMETQLKAKDNPTYQLFLYNWCKSNILFFINTFIWTYDPRLDAPHIPFVTYPFQDDIITWQLWLMKNREAGLIEKSRDMGATWCMEAVSVWLTIFYPGITDYQLSLREEDVDNRAEDSLLGKYRYMVRNLPEFLRGGWIEKEQDIDNKMKIRIPDTGSMCRGQLTGGTSGRSGRATRAFYDEFAFIEDSTKVLKASASLTPSPLFLSTANGMGNEFYKMSSSPFVKKKTLHWTLHPMKNEMWAKKERAKVMYTDETWAQEHEISYEMSQAGRVFGEFVSFASDYNDWCHVQEDDYYRYDPAYDVVVGIDFGMADPTSVVFGQLKPPPEKYGGLNAKHKLLVIFDEYESNNKTVDEWAALLQSKARSRSQPQGYQYSDIVGDYRSGNQRTPTGWTWIKYLASHGIHVVGKYSTEQKTLFEMKRILQRPGGFAVNRDHCPHTIKSFQNWHYKVNKQTGQVSPNAKPEHSQWSHCMKAMVYLVDWTYGQKTVKEEEDDEWNFGILSTSRNI